MKVCTKCAKRQPDRAFSPELRSPDGLRSNCKPCANRDAVLRRRRKLDARPEDAK